MGWTHSDAAGRVIIRDGETAKPFLSEADFEQMLDVAVLGRIRQDAAYQHAESAEAQEAREDEIAKDEVKRIALKYHVEGFDPDWSWDEDEA